MKSFQHSGARGASGRDIGGVSKKIPTDCKVGWGGYILSCGRPDSSKEDQGEDASRRPENLMDSSSDCVRTRPGHA